MRVSTSAAPRPATGRRHDLDALRVVAVLLLIPFHTARLFDGFDPFYVKADQTNDVLSWGIVAFLNPWHMPLLFVLAGAATWLALEHRSTSAYAGERVKRLLIPFAFGLLVIVPPQALLARLFRGADVGLGSFLADYWTVEGDLSGYTGSFTPGHLWFVGFLFIFSMIALPLFARWRRRPVGARWLVFAMPVVLLLANEFPAPDDGPQNPWYSIALFVAGFLLVADARAERLVHRRRRLLALAAAVTMTIVLTVWITDAGDSWSDGSLLDIAFALFETTTTWVWVLALLGAARALLDRDTATLRYASEASYPVYILHQTVIVAVGYVVLDWGLGVWPSFAIVATVSLALSVAIYELLVRRTAASRFVFGMKPRRRPATTDEAAKPLADREPALR